MEAMVSASAVNSASLLHRQLSIGWETRTERDSATGKSIVFIFCPDHKPDHM
jgi:hypothetical protein